MAGLQTAPLALGTTAGTAAEGTAPAAAVGAHNSDASAHPGTFAPATHTSDANAHPGLFAAKLANKTENFTAAAFGRYQTVGTIVVTDPVSATAGDSYMVRIASGTATIGGVAYAPSRFDIIRFYNGSAWATSPAVITGGLTVDGLTRKLLASYTVPQAPALTAVTYDSGTKTFTCTAHGMSNGQVVKLLAGTGALPAGFTAWTSDFTGVPYFVVNRAANTFQLSASAGGAAVTTSDSGTAGWTATPMGVSSVTISGLSIAAGCRIRVLFNGLLGVGYQPTPANGYLTLNINNDSGNYYRSGIAEHANISHSSNPLGNVLGVIDYAIHNFGNCVACTLHSLTINGTDNTFANSACTSGTIRSSYMPPSPVTITSLVFSDGSGASQCIKPGTVITIEQEA